jgi:hypothetical protein
MRPLRGISWLDFCFCAVAFKSSREFKDNCDMGFRFRRSIKILPGVRLNFGKRGISTSIGIRGAHITLGKTGTRTTVGLPGSGLSYTHLENAHHDSPKGAHPADLGIIPRGKTWRGWLSITLLFILIVVAAQH